jgi:hypothetical protein
VILMMATAVALGLATMLVSAVSVGIVRATSGWSWALWSCAALLSLERVGRFLVGRYSSSPDAALQKDLTVLLTTALFRIARFTAIHPEDLGLRVFVVRRDRLTRLAGVRFSLTPSMHKPRWARGKGVVGRALEKESMVAINWRREVYDVAVAQGSEAWSARSRTDRFGMDWRELKETRDYGVIAARPIPDLRRGGAFGVIAIDARGESADALLFDDLESWLQETGNLVLGRYQQSKGRWLVAR